MTDHDLLYTEVEEDLRATVRDLLTSRCPAGSVIAVYDGDRAVVAPLWKALTVELGLAGLLVPESLGGAGASAREAAVVLEELGRAVAPVPYLTSSVLALAALGAVPGVVPGEGDDVAAGSAEAARQGGDDRRGLVAALATGERTATLVLPLGTSPSSFAPLEPVGTGLTGRVTSVAGALEADVLLVPVAGQAGVELHVVDAADASVEPVTSLDMTRQLADVAFDRAASRVVVDDAGDAVRGALGLGAALLASEQVGLAQWCLDATVAYLGERRQFGRVVGGFQALKHRLADLYAMVEQARAAARYSAATAAAADPEAEIAASVAQAYCADVAVRAAEECVQLHGGIGVTWEHPAHLYLKRAKAEQIALGTPDQHRAHLAELVDLPT